MKTTSLLLSLAMALSAFGVGSAQTASRASQHVDSGDAGGAPPLGMPIDGDRAQQVLAAAEAEARKNNFSVSLAVVDPNGNLVMFKRMPPHPGPVTGPIAIRLAQTAAHTRIPTKMLGAMMSATGIPVVQLIPDAVALDGGYPIVVDGKFVGAIGAFGATVEQNARAAAAGAASVR